MPKVTLYAAALLIAGTCSAESRIGGIEFFGYGGLDVAAIRSGLPLNEGTPWVEENRRVLREFVKVSVGTDATDIAVVSCDEGGDRWVYIGLQGGTSKAIRFLDEPAGALRLPQELLQINARLESALRSAVERGGDAVQEDRSRGYALTNDPSARSLELKMRDYALERAPQIFAVLADSSDAQHRAIAAEAAGYAEHTATQVHVLSRATRDPNRTVRNNAIRALSVLAGSDIELAVPIEAFLFIELLSSGSWEDRNKSVAVLLSLTQSRDIRLLSEIKERSLNALVESARWRWIGHSYGARVILGRIAALEESVIVDDASTSDFVDAVLSRIRKSRTP